MLKDLDIEDFKGITSVHRAEFAPLPKLLGGKRAGKSSILHALFRAPVFARHFIGALAVELKNPMPPYRPPMPRGGRP